MIDSAVKRELREIKKLLREILQQEEIARDLAETLLDEVITLSMDEG